MHLEHQPEYSQIYLHGHNSVVPVRCLACVTIDAPPYNIFFSASFVLAFTSSLPLRPEPPELSFFFQQIYLQRKELLKRQPKLMPLR